MNISEAEKIYRELGYKSIRSEDEEFMLTEALEYLVRETKDTGWMVELGGYYYEEKKFDLALKYYELADMYGDNWAPEGLGYIWYYGRTGTKDYEKAFHYYQKAAEKGNLKSKVKLADMYKNGYYVERDYAKYVRLIEEMYPKVENTRNLYDPKPEVYTRLARIREEEGNTEEAVRLSLDTKDFLAQRIRYNTFFGDLNIMKWLEEDLYRLIPLYLNDVDLFDLYIILREPAEVTFRYGRKIYTVVSVEENNETVIRFEDKWYRTVDDFFMKASINGQRIPVLYSRLYDFRVNKNGTDQDKE